MAQITKYYGIREFTEMGAVKPDPDAIVMPPRRVTVAGPNTVKVFNAHNGAVVSRKIQNVGLTHVSIYIQETDPLSPVDVTARPHIILAPASDSMNGDGAQLDCSQFTSAVWAYGGSSGVDLITLFITLPDGNTPSVP